MAQPVVPSRTYQHPPAPSVPQRTYRSTTGTRPIIKKSSSSFRRPRAPGLDKRKSQRRPKAPGLSNNAPTPKIQRPLSEDAQHKLQVGKEILSDAGLLPQPSKQSTIANSHRSHPRPPLPRKKKQVLARALYDFEADFEEALSFAEGDVFEVLSKDSDWWSVMFFDVDRKQHFGEKGLVPNNYVEIVPFEQVQHVTNEESNGLGSRQNSTSDRSLSRSISSRQTSSFGQSSGHQVLRRKGSSISSSRSTVADEKQAKRLSRLFQATLEVVASEYKYLLDLAIVRDAFILPLNKAGKTALVRSVFSVWENMLAVHDKLLQEMMTALPDVAMLRDTLGALPRGNPGDEINKRTSLNSKRLSSDKLAVNWELDGAKLQLLEQLHGMYFKERPLTKGTFWTNTLAKWAQECAKVMLLMSDYLKVSIPYIANYQGALEVLENNEDQMSIQVMEAAESDLKGLHLRDYLIKPVQRVCKYSLLMREIYRLAPDDQTETLAKKAQDKLHAITNTVNEMVRQMEKGGLLETYHAVKDLFRPRSTVHSLGLDRHFTLPTTRLYRKDDLTVVSASGSELRANETYVAFLFTDFFIFTEMYVNHFKAKERFSIRKAFKFDAASEVERIEGHENKAFKVVVSKTEFAVIKAPSSFTRDGWVADFNMALQAARNNAERRRMAQGVGKPQSSVQQQQAQSLKKPSFTFGEDNPGMANALLLAREFKSLQRRKR